MQTFTINTFAYATQEQALLSIFNKGTTGVIYIKSLEIVPNSPMAATTPNATRRTFQQISACSGGFVLPYRKSNLGSADLPSQVQILRRPDAVTFVSGIYRSIMPMPISIAGLSLRSGGNAFGKGSRMGSGDIWATSKDNNIQGLILREGEGFAFGATSATVPVYPFSFWLTVTFRNTATNATYFIFTQIAPEEMKESSFCIFNGSGSGITLEIMDMKLLDLGSPLNTLPLDASYIRLIRTTNYDGGTVVTPTPTNLANSVPTALDVRKNYVGDDLYVTMAGGNAGFNAPVDLAYPNTNTATVRKIGTFGTRLSWQGAIGGPGINSFGSPVMPGKFLANGISVGKNPIALNPGEGFAVVQSNNTGYAEFYIEATIQYDQTIFTPTEIADAVWTRTGRTTTA